MNQSRKPAAVYGKEEATALLEVARAANSPLLVYLLQIVVLQAQAIRARQRLGARM